MIILPHMIYESARVMQEYEALLTEMAGEGTYVSVGLSQGYH
jgi:hypothetical protein